MAKILIDEELLDELLLKSLPPEYEVLLDDVALTDEEKDYYYCLLMILDGQVNEVKRWLTSNEFQQILNDIEKLSLDFFDDFKLKIRVYIQDRFETLLLPLLLGYYVETNNVIYSSFNKKPILTDNDLLNFVGVRQYNYNLLTNLCDDLDKNFKDIILEGIIKGKDVNEIANELEIAGVSPLNKHTAQQRAKMIARTEVNSVKNKARLQAFKDNNVEWVNVNTQHDNRVCQDCLDIEANNPYPITEVEDLLPVHPNCYDENTEVYTSDGWKLFKDVTLNDNILTLNPENKITEFVKPVNVISYDNPYGYMYYIHNEWFNCCVTPNHDCFIYQRKMVNKVRGDYPEFRKPSELDTESKFLRTVNNNNISPEYVNVNGLDIKSSDYAFLMAWYISEGSVLHNPKTAKSKNYPIKITQIKKDTRKILKKELTRIADYLGIKLYIGKDYFELHSKELYDYLLPLGYSYEKYIPDELFSLSKDDLNIFLDNYVLGDGSIKENSNELIQKSISKNLFTTSINLINDLSYVILLAGYYPSIRKVTEKGNVVHHHNGTYIQNHDCYVISMNTSNYALVTNCEVEKIPYDGKVYCVELPKYHTLWTKRNGQTSWNGNCRCYFTPVKTNDYNFDEFGEYIY